MNRELALIPAPGAGHLAPMVELGKSLTSQDHRISVTIFIMELPTQSIVNSYGQSLLSNEAPPRIRFVQLTLEETASKHLNSIPRQCFMNELNKINKSRVKDFYSSESAQNGSVSAFVVDMFCTPFADVAAELGAPTYVFVTTNAHFLSLVCYLQTKYDEENQDFTEFKDSDTKLSVPGFANLVPAKVLPFFVFENGWLDMFLDVPRKLRKAKGLLVNTFPEFESYTIKCLSEDETMPPIYTVGPVLDPKTWASNDQNDLGKFKAIITWLDSQPPESVVFLCFGSMGTFEAEQVVEVANALEKSGHRFLWSLRRPSPKGKIGSPSEYENFNDVLPEGFLDRTKDIGKVIGWAPQVEVLSHPATGGFVSHCGWNSILESLWCGVPIATWPMYSEQQLNAFEIVKELGLAIEIKLDYSKDNPILVTAKEIEMAIKELMEGSTSAEIRKKVKAMGEESRRAVIEGGSSYAAVGNVVEEIINGSS